MASALVAAFCRERRERLRAGLGPADGDSRRTALRLVYMVLSLLPSLAVVTLAWFVVRAISVRVVWRDTAGRPLDDKTA